MGVARSLAAVVLRCFPSKRRLLTAIAARVPNLAADGRVVARSLYLLHISLAVAQYS
jgi:hypothetical protein